MRCTRGRISTKETRSKLETEGVRGIISLETADVPRPPLDARRGIVAETRQRHVLSRRRRPKISSSARVRCVTIAMALDGAYVSVVGWYLGVCVA